MSRRSLLRLAAGGAVAAGLAAAGVLYENAGLRYKVEEHLGLDPGPDLALPASGAHLVTGAFDSRTMKADVAYAYSLPAKGAPGRSSSACMARGATRRRCSTCCTCPTPPLT
ncbi:MAG TPA: hypothetical protein VMS00_09500 [Acidimicrobiales bacterium]|nr:hypothetical protein [Acidimicrobiales bacterium]